MIDGIIIVGNFIVNMLTMLEVAQWLKHELNLPVNIWDAGPRHHLWMDCSKIKEHGIYFNNTIDGLKKCIQDYSL
jgi:dTDP-4-dehydrorhamnose reductase